MHKLVRVLVYAKNGEGALNKAKGLLEDRLCGEGRDFDYFTTFDDDESTVSGRSRWGDYPAFVKATTDTGRKLIGDGWQFTEKEFDEHMDEIRKAIAKHSNLQLREREMSPEMMFRWHCDAVGFSACHYWLFDHDGEPIRDQKHLKNTLSKWDLAEEYEGLDVWVVPADVHL